MIIQPFARQVRLLAHPPAHQIQLLAQTQSSRNGAGLGYLVTITGSTSYMAVTGFTCHCQAAPCLHVLGVNFLNTIFHL